MNDFGINLTGKKVVYKAKQFYLKNSTLEQRTFLAESGPGCLPTLDESIGHFAKPYGFRTIFAVCEDGVREAIDSYALESYINQAGRVIPRPDMADLEEDDVKATLFIPAAKPAPAAAPKKVAVVDTGNNFAAKVVKAAAQKQVELIKQAVDSGATSVLQIHDDIVVATDGKKEWNTERAVALHKSGMKIIDIAVEMGYPRGSGCNRTKAALHKAGVL